MALIARAARLGAKCLPMAALWRCLAPPLARRSAGTGCRCAGTVAAARIDRGSQGGASPTASPAWLQAGAVAFAGGVVATGLAPDRPPTLAEETSDVHFTCFGEVMLRFIPDTSDDSDTNAFQSRWLRNAGGAELNIVVSLSRLGWGSRARWVSTLPDGLMGDETISLISSAFPDPQRALKDNLSLVRRMPGEDVGVYHVWPQKGVLEYQRKKSAFALADPAWFDQAFWTKVLKDGPPGAPKVLHLTGITPQISYNAYRAWWQALQTARTLKAKDPSSRVIVSLDFNHRPLLGSLEDLWTKCEPHLETADIFVIGLGNVPDLGKLLDVREAKNLFRTLQEQDVPRTIAGAEQYNEEIGKAMKAMQVRLGGKCPIALCPKLVEPGTRDANTMDEQLRWSMVCLPNGEVLSTLDTAIRQKPVEPIGGGDSWLSGCIDGLVGSEGPAAVAPKWSKDMWIRAMRQGDMLATLKQQVVGDFSNVERPQLEAAVFENEQKGPYAWKK